MELGQFKGILFDLGIEVYSDKMTGLVLYLVELSLSKSSLNFKKACYLVNSSLNSPS